MQKEAQRKLNDLIDAQLPRFAERLGHYPWPDETARWHELVFCILSAEGRECFAPPDHRTVARKAVKALVELDLLDVVNLARLAAATEAEEDIASDDQALVALRRSVLERLGYPPESVDRILLAVVEVACVLDTAFDGKIQHYLRRAGERMVGEMADIFRLRALGEMQARYVLTHWLQNVAAMPLALHNPSMLILCETLGITPDDLCAAADARDMNVALVDDMAIDLVERGLAAAEAQSEAA